MNKLLENTLIFLLAGTMAFIGVTHLIKPQPQPQSVGIALPQAVAIFETSLQTGITKTATSMTLTANSIRGTGSLSGFNCFTVDESSSNAEVICGTVSGTAVSSLTRGISYEDGETEVAGNKYSHRRGASVKITDFPIIQRLKAQNNGDATFVNQLTYESYLTPVDDEDIISKKYADDLAIAGSPDASLTVKGITEIASQTGMASTSVAGSGDTTAWLSLTSAYSTSTPSGDSYSALHLPVSENDGKLSQLWLDLTEAFTWTGNHIFNGTVDIAGLFTTTATSTMATTTIAELTITNDLTVSGDATGVAKSVDIQIFTSNGTWTKPTNALFIEVHLFSGGGGGGSGKRVDGGTAASGTGGGGGGYSVGKFNASALGSTEAVVIGVGGTGGASVSTVANGNNGTAGGHSKFGTTAIIRVGGGAAGLGGVAESEAGGAGGLGNYIHQTGGVGGANSAIGINTAADVSPRGGGGGGNENDDDGANGGAFTTNYVAAGGIGGATNSGASGTNGTDGSTTFIRGGTGGGGGEGEYTSGNAGAGGDGGDIGGGGGGGGAIGNLTGNSGAGGDGGTGAVIVITHF